ncbi:MAG: competence/damage-inducible protein A [Acidobacteriaceae bacterium]|nr:competence/damage-inducible protein A [Acidobacteriaceae bacterium]
MPKNAEIIAVGSELLTPQRIDTNSLTITHHLNAIGVEVVAKHVIGDDRTRLSDTIRLALERSEIIILSGGLGPTEDDVTRDAVAAALGRKLAIDLQQELILRAKFEQIRRPMAAINLRQAHLIEGAEPLPNPNGSAPGQYIELDGRAVALLPGPPHELKPMLENELLRRLRKLLPGEVIKTRSFRLTGIGESDLDTLIAPVYTKYDNPVTTVLSSPGDLSVHLRARAATEADADELLHEVGDPIAELLGVKVYTEDPDESLEAVVGRLLKQQGATVATAESCTGGLIAYRLTEIAGSSDYFVAGYVTYSEAEKREVLGVPGELIESHTAVSEPVAAAMAEGARRRGGATYGLSVTGYAGPSGGTEQDPVGTVYTGIATTEGTRVLRVRYGMGRTRIRTLAAQFALDLLRRTLMGSYFHRPHM